MSDLVVIALNGVSSAGALILKVRGIVVCNFVAPGGAGAAGAGGECKKSSARPDLLGYYLVHPG